MLNIRSLRNKIDEVKMLLYVCRFEILAITETHLDDKIPNKQITIDGDWGERWRSEEFVRSCSRLT